MFGKKKTKNVSNESGCGAKASNMTSGSKSTKSCGAKSCSNKTTNTSNTSNCHNTRGASNNNTKSCS